MEWAKQQQPGDSAAKVLLLILADRSEGATYLSKFTLSPLQCAAGLDEGEFKCALDLLVEQGLVGAPRDDGSPNSKWREVRFSLLIPNSWRPPNAVRRPTSGDDAEDPRYVYRLYGADGDLFYVGIARWPEVRLEQHAKAQPWWYSVVTRELVWYENLHLALAEEYRAIQDEQPRYNIMLAPKGSDAPSRARRRRYAVINRPRERFEHALGLMSNDLRSGMWDVGVLPPLEPLAQRYDETPDLVSQVRDRLLQLGEIAVLPAPRGSVATYVRPWSEW